MRLVSEDFGNSELAERFGVARYPAVFVNDVLFAKPKDFGFNGKAGSQGAGRYTPWLEAESRARFKADLERMVALALRGELEGPGADRTDSPDEEGPILTHLPEFEVEDLLGTAWSSDDLRETVTIVEFWASWCPPCLRTVPWLAALQERHPDRLRVIAIAVESPADDVRRIFEDNELPFPVVMGPPEVAALFGDLTATPTMFVFDRGGALVSTAYGDPPYLEDETRALVERLLERKEGDR